MRVLFSSLLVLALAGCAEGTQPSSSAPVKAIAQASPTAQASVASLRSLRGSANMLSAAYVSKRFEQVYSSLPPAYLEQLRRQSGLTQQQHRQSYIKRQQDGSTDLSLSSMNIDVLENAFRQGKRGTVYALLPTERQLPLKDGKRVSFVGSTVALQENGKWHFVVLDTVTQFKVLQSAYPDLRGLKWPGLKIEKASQA